MTSRTLILLNFLDYQSYSTQQILTLYYAGARFDLKLVSALFLLFFFLPWVASRFVFKAHSKKITKWLDKVLFSLLALLLLVCIIGLGFYQFYHHDITPIIFGIKHDGFDIVMGIMLSMPHIVLLIVLFIFILIASAIIFIKKQNTIKYDISSNKKSIIANIVLMFILLVVFSRGSFDTFPLSRKTNYMNTTAELNALAINSPYRLYYAYKDNNENKFDFDSKKIGNLQTLKQKAGYNYLNPLKRITNNTNKELPNIVFVLMEGWSSRIALEHSEENNNLGEFSRHKKTGYYFTNFFSNANDTNDALERLIVNSPILRLSQSKANKVQLKTSNITPFNKNGYLTRFISGISGEWRNTRYFYKNQGFKDFFDRGNIDISKRSNNPRGAYDGDVFSFVKTKIQEPTNSPHFTFVLTTNNHPPVVIPKDQYRPINAGDKYSKKQQQMLDGYYYQSNEFGKFMSWLKGSNFSDNTIVVATGDHTLRNFYNYKSNKFDHYKYSVPLYIHIPKKYDRLISTDKNVFGSLSDIFPTLFELSLPKTEYIAHGTSIINKKLKDSFGWNQNANGYKVISDSGVFDKSQLMPWSEKYKTLDVGLSISPEDDNYKRIQQIKFKDDVFKYLITKDVEDS